MTEDHTACNGREKTCAEEKARLSEEIARLNGEIKTVEETKASLDQEVTTLKSKSGAQVQDLMNQLEEKNIEVAQQNDEINELKIALGAEQEKVSTKTQSEEACNQAKAGLNADITALKTSKEESEQACIQAKTGLTNNNDALKKMLQECESKVSGLEKDRDDTTINSSNQVS